MTISATTQGLRMGVATSSSRPTVPFDGQVISETDTDSLQVYKGTAWAPASGLTFITSATASAASSLSVNSCFTTSYANYLVLINMDGSSASAVTLNVRFRVGSTDNTAASYVSMSTSNTNVGGPTRTFSAAQTSAQLGCVSDTMGYVQATFFNPQVAEQTECQTNWTNISTSSPNSHGNGSASHVTTTQFDGFTLIPASGTITGTVRVYGYSNS